MGNKLANKENLPKKIKGRTISNIQQKSNIIIIIQSLYKEKMMVR
jgi:hypothetical protein